MSFREWQRERATTEALDAARAKARTPTVDEFTAAINGVGEPPKRQRRRWPKREQHDSRDLYFSLWLDHIVDGHWMNKIKESSGGFDVVSLAKKIIDGGFCNESKCHTAILKAREAITLIDSVLAEVDKQKGTK